MTVRNKQPAFPASPDSPSTSSPPLRPSSPSIPLPRLRSTPELSVHSIDTYSDEVVALAGPPQDFDTDMEPEQSGHRRRRSSIMNSLRADTNSKRKSRRRGSPKSGAATGADDSLTEDPKLERSTDESLSDGELDDLSDDGLQDDEETGLTGKDKGKRKNKRRRNTLLDQRIAGEVKVVISDEEKKEADQNVVRKSLINGLLICMWYVFSLSISIYNKWMFDPKHLDFHFPLFTTCFHMIVQFTLSSLVLFFLPQFRPRYDSLSNPDNTTHVSDADAQKHEEDSKKPLMTRMFYFTRIGPCGMATGLDVGLGNMSLKFITLTFYTMCKSSSLAFVLLFAFLFRLEVPSWRLVGIIFTMTLGVMMMVAGEVDFSVLGFILVISAAFFSGFRWGLTQILLLRNPATSNPFSSIFYLAPIMFFSLLIIAIPVEGFPALAEGFKILIDKKGSILGPGLLLFPGAIAFCMTASEFALLQRTSVVTLSIAGIFKEVVTISAAGLVFHDPLTPINISGLFVTIGAIAAYNWIKIKKMREDAQHEAHLARVAQRGDGSDGDDEGTESDSETGDWNTAGGTYVTSDGDILPSPGFYKPKKGEGSKKTVESGMERKKLGVGKEVSE
ncbi:related to vanadate resistance protein Gog5p, member of the triose phosphate translocater family of membrane transporters [Rhynchosporium agropyri]|uniref:Related to vanadate resistance protein Gog5p, member of the triose phosphate translocater family of membrane transporters n=1 Tax=Rhynchosporium agropyri TaxID=914238 RepID=A0A1E1KSJ9_9HELO|nr:related to vanadate resistance protein Gog5p, member of the triose phosphate translocater family of membrane transporters [Rhynchosporium agropyri]